MVINISHNMQKVKNYLPFVPTFIVGLSIFVLSYGILYIFRKILIWIGLITPSNVFALALVPLLTVVLGLYILLGFMGYGYHRGQRYLNDKFLQNNEYIHGNCDGEYSAILIGNNVSWSKKISVNMCICGLKYLEEHFKNTHKDYKIFQKIDTSCFHTIVSDNKCQELYILGHGSKGTFAVSSDKSQDDWQINYLKYKNQRKKRIIAQLHCAATHHERNNVSLVDLLAIDVENSYVGNGYATFIEVWWYCIKMLKKSK